MKKVVSFLLTFALLLSCTGCSQSGVSQEEYDALKGQYEALQGELDAMKSGIEKSSAAETEETAAPETEETVEKEEEESTAPETEETEEISEESDSALKIIKDDTKTEATDAEAIHGGTNQNDAVMLPMNTKLYGKTSGESGLWYAFTTGSEQNAVYYITTINKTPGTNDLCLNVFDDYGNWLNNGRTLNAKSSGDANTLSLEQLDANTTYYIKVWADRGDTISYMLRIRNPEGQYDGYSTTDSLTESRGTDAMEEEEIAMATNLDDASVIPTDVKLSGTVRDEKYVWFAFMTNAVENATYGITTVNMTTGTNDLCLNIYDDYGKWLNNGRTLNAGSGGTASTLSLELSPNTTYYVRIWADRGDTIDYTLSIHAPEEPEVDMATIEKDALVFETPFELNSTQVMFVANKAVFIDEAAAKTALEPVAEVILAHPDHPILLAGTTATDGTQESCVNLSNKRAEAVKNLLVSAFGVPKSQIQTIGLGYEADPFERGKDRVPEGDVNGRFVESEGAKNRRVIVLDVNDPIAQELLNE